MKLNRFIKMSFLYHFLLMLINVFIYLLIPFLLALRLTKQIKKTNYFKIISVHENTGLGKAAKLIYFELLKKFSCNLIFLKTHMVNKSYKLNKGTNIYVGNPDIFINILLKLNLSTLVGNYNIGYWFWELENVPKKWFFLNLLVDEVWVNSDFNYKSLEKISKKVIKVPFYLDINLKIIKNNSFGFLPKNKFIFYFNFDFLSHYERKNPEAIVTAFTNAFNSNDNVHLVLKSVNGHLRMEHKLKLQKMIGDYRNIELIDQYFSYERHINTLAKVDCYISLHRAEGLGLGMAEAMYLGKPVIATGYSGNLEFMNRHNSCLVRYKMIPVKKTQYIYSKNQFWADPILDDAVRYMRKIKNNKQFRQDIGKKASIDLKTRFSSNNFQKFLLSEFN